MSHCSNATPFLKTSFSTFFSAQARRALGSLARPLLALCLLAFMAAAPAATAADIVVDEANDDDNGNGLCSLREAVEAANTNAAVDGCEAGDPDSDIIRFDLGAGAVVVVDDGELTLADDVTVAGGDGVTLDAEGNSRIFNVNVTDGDVPGELNAVTFRSLVLANGNASANSSAPDAGGAVDVKPDDEVTFAGVDVTGSQAGLNGGGVHAAGGTSVTYTGGTVTGNTAGEEGGGLWSAGQLTVADGTLVDGNTAGGDDADQGGGGIYLDGSDADGDLENGVVISNNAASGALGSGGGILNNGGRLSIDVAEVSGNTANRAGGGIEDAGGRLSPLVDATITGNEATGAGDAPGYGGGIHSTSFAIVEGGTISGNTAVRGGGIWTNGNFSLNDDGDMSMTVTENVATGNPARAGGGGIYIAGSEDTRPNVNITNAQVSGNEATGTSGSGGGIFKTEGDLTISESDVTGNTASRAGGGIENLRGPVTVTRSTLADNDAGANPGNGGGLHATRGRITFNGGTVDDNAAVEGGGFWISNGTLSTNGTRIRRNTASGAAATQGGGGLYLEAGGENGDGDGSATLTETTVLRNEAIGTSGSGGGIINLGGDLTLNQGTVVRLNTANRAGGGIESARGRVNITNSTLTDNDAGANPGNGGAFHITGLTARATITTSTITENTAVEGGGVWSRARLLTVDGGTIANNTASGDAADQGGGGIYVEPQPDNEQSNRTVTVRRTIIERNQATGESGSGGGILNNDGELNINQGASIRFNTANRAGGGIETAGGTVTIRASSVRRNAVADGEGSFDDDVQPSPGNGGGLHAGGGAEVTVRRSTFSLNRAIEGGGLWIAAGNASLDMDNSTVSLNEATTGDGGGIYDDGGAGADAAGLALTSTTVARNEAGGDGGGLRSNTAEAAGDENFTFGNTVVAENTAGGSGADCAGAFTSNDYNLIQSTDGCEIIGETGNNITGEDPELGPLAENGGLTRTHLPQEFSPLIDSGNDLAGASTDQRGAGSGTTSDPEFPRTQDNPNAENDADGTDIGSAEAPEDTVVPVELASFTVRTDGQSAVLEWQTATEENNSGFHIEQRRRSAGGGEGSSNAWSRVGFVESKVEGGTSAEPLRYQHRLSSLDYGAYTFRLVQEDLDGTSTTLGVERSVEITLSEAFALSQAYPNPAHGGQPATVKLTVREAQDVQAVLYDALGRQVRVLHQGAVSGQQTLPLRVETGDLSSGMYFLRATGEKFSATRKLVLVR